MKKIFLLMVLFVSGFTLMACNGEEEIILDQPNGEQEDTSEKEEKEDKEENNEKIDGLVVFKNNAGEYVLFQEILPIMISTVPFDEIEYELNQIEVEDPESNVDLFLEEIDEDMLLLLEITKEELREDLIEIYNEALVWMEEIDESWLKENISTFLEDIFNNLEEDDEKIVKQQIDYFIENHMSVSDETSKEAFIAEFEEVLTEEHLEAIFGDLLEGAFEEAVVDYVFEAIEEIVDLDELFLSVGVLLDDAEILVLELEDEMATELFNQIKFMYENSEDLFEFLDKIEEYVIPLLEMIDFENTMPVDPQ